MVTMSCISTRQRPMTCGGAWQRAHVSCTCRPGNLAMTIWSVCCVCSGQCTRQRGKAEDLAKWLCRVCFAWAHGKDRRCAVRSHGKHRSKTEGLPCVARKSARQRPGSGLTLLWQFMAHGKPVAHGKHLCRDQSGKRTAKPLCRRLLGRVGFAV